MDPHLHLLSAAAHRLSVDLGGVATAAAVVARLAEASPRLTPSQWLRAVGYDASRFVGQEVDRLLLDAVDAPNPIVVHETTGHQVVCNTEALRRLGAAEDRSGRVELCAGVPTGRITDAPQLLTRVPRLGREEMTRSLGELSLELAAAGVTAVTDATHTNGLEELAFLDQVVSEAPIHQHVEVMVGIEGLGAVAAEGLRFGSSLKEVTVGHVKLVPEAHPEYGVEQSVAEAVARGWPVAIHVLDVEGLHSALGAIERWPAPVGTRHRLEHVALSLPEQVTRIARSGAAVVTQPEFAVRRREKYERELSPVERAWLYRMASLRAAGVPLAASSDRPTLPTTPLGSFAAACGAHGLPTAASPKERVGPQDALSMITAAARAVGSVRRGTPRAAQPRDHVVLDCHPLRSPGCVPRVIATYIKGRQIFGPVS